MILLQILEGFIVSKLELLRLVKSMGFNYPRISLTKDCNGACPFCHNEGQTIGKRGELTAPELSLLSIDGYEYIAKFFRGHLKSVSLTGGELTLVKNLPEIISVVQKLGLSPDKQIKNGYLNLLQEAKLRSTQKERD